MNKNSMDKNKGTCFVYRPHQLISAQVYIQNKTNVPKTKKKEKTHNPAFMFYFRNIAKRE